jgi:nucleoside-diphosphate-sugar epimerase
VIGATGFVGRTLVPVLAQRGQVIAVSRRGTAPDVVGVAGRAEALGESFDVGDETR